MRNQIYWFISDLNLNFQSCSVETLVAMDAIEHMASSTTDLARAWESVPELRRRAQRHELVSSLYDMTFVWTKVDTSKFISQYDFCL